MHQSQYKLPPTTLSSRPWYTNLNRNRLADASHYPHSMGDVRRQTRPNKQWSDRKHNRNSRPHHTSCDQRHKYHQREVSPLTLKMTPAQPQQSFRRLLPPGRSQHPNLVIPTHIDQWQYEDAIDSLSVVVGVVGSAKVKTPQEMKICPLICISYFYIWKQHVAK